MVKVRILTAVVVGVLAVAGLGFTSYGSHHGPKSQQRIAGWTWEHAYW
jgi:hypothetical protein